MRYHYYEDRLWRISQLQQRVMELEANKGHRITFSPVAIPADSRFMQAVDEYEQKLTATIRDLEVPHVGAG